MAKNSIRKKQSYGGCTISHLSPARADGWPKAINREHFAVLDVAIDRIVWQLVGLAPDRSLS